MRCPKCQAKIESDAVFCIGCGSKVIAQKQSAPADKTAPSSGSKGCLAFSAILAALVLVAALGLSYLAYKHYKTPDPGPTSAVQSQGTPPAAQTHTSDVAPKSPRPANVNSAKPVLEDISGDWTLVETGVHLYFQIEGAQLVTKPSDDGELRLGFLGEPGYTMHGTYSDSTSSYPATAEMSLDGQSMTLTLAPPASEYIVIELTRGTQ